MTDASDADLIIVGLFQRWLEWQRQRKLIVLLDCRCFRAERCSGHVYDHPTAVTARYWPSPVYPGDQP